MGGLNIFRNDKKRRIFFLSINRGTLKRGFEKIYPLILQQKGINESNAM